MKLQASQNNTLRPEKMASFLQTAFSNGCIFFFKLVGAMIFADLLMNKF